MESIVIRSKGTAFSFLRKLFKCLGPAFIVSVAYIDPGNFAANISAGSKYNYSLIWVILISNLIAIFLQTMSAKLGIATGLSLPEMCGRVFSRRVNWLFWIAAELGAMITNLAEFLGAALGLYLLFNIPIQLAGIITALITYFICSMEKYGQRVVEVIITALVAGICIAYSIELLITKPDWNQAFVHALMPNIPGNDALLTAVSMLGATVMPHVIYLHSELVSKKNCEMCYDEKLVQLKMEKIDIAVAMNIAFVVNAAMVMVSAAVFYKNGIVVDTIAKAHSSLAPIMGPLSSGAFGIALLISGLSSSAVGTMAGQSIMKGFVDYDIPLNARRLITMIPALAIIMLGVNTMKALVISQVMLCFILPFPIIQMLIIAGKENLMGRFVNKKWAKITGIGMLFIIIGLNAALIYFST
ncbi:MAG: Nramp family divalent metal transporter [Solirubrobacterales bacterium]